MKIAYNAEPGIVGQVPYQSRITEQTEYLPVAATMAGARGTFSNIPRGIIESNGRSGSDLMLINLAQAALRSAAWSTEVETGSLAFRLGNGEENRDEVRNVQVMWTPEVSPKLGGVNICVSRNSP